MKSENWRNSDCQFSITAPPKSGEMTYDHHETGLAVLGLVGVVRVPARERLADERDAKMPKKKSESPFSRTNRLIPAGRSA